MIRISLFDTLEMRLTVDQVSRSILHFSSSVLLAAQYRSVECSYALVPKLVS